MEHQLQRAVPRTRVQKDKRRGMQQTENSLPAIVGKANLYDVISYQCKNSFLKDKNKHFASSNYGNPKYGFLLNQTKRFEVPIPIRGKLCFFNVELNSFNLDTRMTKFT